MKIKNVELEICQADLTALSVDAIVNAANNKLLMGGGVAGVIKAKGGAQIEREAVSKGPIAVGESIATGAGSLKAKYVIHAATMAMDFQTDETKIRQSCASALQCAQQLKLHSIAFPALGCGVGGFPLKGAAQIMTQEVMKYAVDTKDPSLQRIIFCLHESKAHETFQSTVTNYVEYRFKELAWGPYVTIDVIVELPEGVVIVERLNSPYGWCLPGGFVDRWESIEDAARREIKEETGLELDHLRQFHTYSHPSRDPRFHTVSTVFIAEGKGTPQAGDDAKNIKVVPYAELLNHTYAFDHHKILTDYSRVQS